jgi:hypothetical protein
MMPPLNDEIGRQEYVIFSGDKPDLSPSTLALRRHDILTFCAHLGIDCKMVLGSYKGQPEVSFLVSRQNFDLILASGYINNQDCVLLLGPCDRQNRRPATLRGISTLEERQSRTGPGKAPAASWLTWASQCGLFQEIDPKFLMQFDQAGGWTYDPRQRRFFACQ